MNTDYRITLPLLTPGDAAPRSAELLTQAQNKLGFVPNLYAALAHSPGALETYLLGYDRFRAQSGFTPVEQDVVFLAISVENDCDYCKAAHCFVGEKMSHVTPTVTAAIRNNAEIPDVRLQALASLARSLVRTRGHPPKGEVQAFLQAGYTEPQIVELILAVAVKTVSNYTNHLFETPIDAVFQAV